MDFNFQFDYDTPTELIFNFGAEIVIIDFTETPYTPSISEEICFDFGGVIAEPEITGNAIFTFPMVGVTDVSFIAPTQRWLIGEVCIEHLEPENISTLNHLPTQDLQTISSTSYIEIDKLVKLSNENCFVTEQPVKLQSDWCLPIKTTEIILVENCHGIDEVIYIVNDWCLPFKNVTLVTHKNLAEYTVTEFIKPIICLEFEYTGEVLHEDIFKYYPENHDLYSPNADFDLNHSSIGIDTPQATGYKPPSEPCFDLVEPTWSQPFNFLEGNDLIEFLIYPDFIPEYIPLHNFLTPYTSIEVIGIPQHNKGVLSSEICAQVNQGVTIRHEFCLTFEQACQPVPGTSVFIEPPRDPHIDPPNVTPYTIPTAENYFMSHSISVTLSDLSTVIHMTNISIDSNLDQHSLNFRAKLLDHSQKDLIIGTPALPVVIVVTVNGEVYHVVCTDYSMSEEFGVTTINVSGKGHSILLDTPYSQIKSVTQGSLLTVQQLADSVLPIGSGWSIIWETTTWLVPASTFSYTNKSPIQALFDIAKSIGAVVIPHHSNKTLTIKPRYPVLPWNFAVATPNITIPRSVIPTVNSQSIVDSEINGVYVHGLASGGKLGFAKLSGTAGDVLAPTTTSSLMTDSIGLRALSERILAGHYTQPLVDSIVLGMDGSALPLIHLGQLADIGGVRGIVNSVSLSATFSKVRQSIKIGETTSNDFTQFQTLLPKDPLLVGTIGSSSNGTSLITLLDGGIVRVLGVGNIGESYYIQSGRLQASAPNLPLTNIVI